MQIWVGSPGPSSTQRPRPAGLTLQACMYGDSLIPLYENSAAAAECQCMYPQSSLSVDMTLSKSIALALRGVLSLDPGAPLCVPGSMATSTGSTRHMAALFHSTFAVTHNLTLTYTLEIPMLYNTRPLQMAFRSVLDVFLQLSCVE